MTRSSTPAALGKHFAWRSQAARLDVKYSPYLFILPFFVLFAVVGLFPLAYTAWVSLHDWSLIGGQGKFVGLANFENVISRQDFWIALRNTISIFVIMIVPHMVIALAIAAALDRNIRNGTFWRMAVLVPFVVAPVAVTLIFNNLFADQFGLINTTIKSLGFDAVAWHSEVFPSHFAIATMVNYRWLGYSSLILLAGMQAIPRDFYEAATIDGAGALRQFFSITLPQLRTTLIFVVITSTIGGLQIFDEPKLFDSLGRGGSDGQWRTLTLLIFNFGWGDMDFGRAAAVAWLLFLIIIVFALINLFLSSRLASNEGRVQ